MDSSESDDDCLLYTRTAEHFIQKRDEIQAKRKELEEVIEFLSEDEVEIALKNDNFSNQTILPNDSEKLCKPQDISPIRIDGLSDSEDDIPLAELSRNLRSKKRRHQLPPPTQKRPKRNTRRRLRPNNREPASQNNDHSVIIFDDDTGYPVDSFPPINFNSRTQKKSRLSDKEGNISLGPENILNEDISLDEDEMIESNDLVTLTIEWDNGKKTERKKFKLRRYQKFESIFEELAAMENVSTNHVLLMYDYKTISPLDTPSSLNLKFYGALIGSVSSSEIIHRKVNFDQEKRENVPGGIQLKLLLQSKQTLLFTALKNQKMDIIYQKCAEELKCDKSQLKLTFDGEYVEPDDTVADLDLEDGDVLHVHVKTT